ncbi:MAG: MFS transporter [Thermoanaerobaculia bacterium]|nr:MAG: MFS transporter [Thermoanaerobaculia bacterium]
MNLLATSRGRLVLFTCLYAAEGAPIGFIWWALPTLLRRRGVELERITSLLALLVLFWTLKFLWAPLVDALRGPRWGLRAWIASAQAAMGLTLLPLVVLDPVRDFTTVAALLAAHSLAAATQDVAIDALAVRTVEITRRGTLNGCMQAGMLVGRSLFGGGALWMEARWGAHGVILGLVAVLGASLALLPFVDERALNPAPAGPLGMATRWRSLAGTLGEAFARPATWAGLAFALLAAAAFEAAGALSGPLLVDRGVAQETIGLFFGLPAALLMLTGALAGGRLGDRSRRLRVLAASSIGFVTAVLAVAAVDHLALEPPAARLVPLAVMYLFVGSFTAVSYSVFMDLTDPRLGGTQFSAYMGATNCCEAWASWAGGAVAARAGYPLALVAMAAVSLASLGLLARLKPVEVRSGEAPRTRSSPR